MELFRRRRNRSTVKYSTKYFLLSDSLDFTANLLDLTTHIHKDKKLRLSIEASHLMNDLLNNMAKQIMQAAKELMVKLQKHNKDARTTMKAHDIKSAVDLLFGYKSGFALYSHKFARERLEASMVVQKE